MGLARTILTGLLLLIGAAQAAGATTAVAPDRLAGVFPGADLAGPFEGRPPAAPVYRGGRIVGYVFSSRAIVASTGYSGKPLDVLIGLDLEGRITGARLIEHHEPILVIGVADADLQAFVRRFKGLDIRRTVRVEGVPREGETAIDGISGASVSSVVISDSILRSARIVARARGILESRGAAALDVDSFAVADWNRLVKDGFIARLHLTNANVDKAFGGAPDPVPHDPQGTFIDLYVALLTPAMVGRNLLDDHRYNRLMAELKPGQQALFVAANGRYSFKGTRYVRTGVFDRIQLVQGERTIRFTKEEHTRIDKIRAAGAPSLREAAFFVLPADAGFDPLSPWRLELFVARRMGAGEVSTSFSLPYKVPAGLVKRRSAGEGTNDDGRTARTAAPVWQEMWQARAGRLGVLLAALLTLTAILFFQDAIARRPRLYTWLRLGYLTFTVIWLGWYAGAQLSVVNVLTFSQALLTQFQWELFLLEPLIFVLWSYVAVTMLFWGRGVFCGWLCPFGALQELLNQGARALRLPQVALPFGLHERLWPLKYVIFLALFAVSLNSMTLAVMGAEVEPFKTAISLGFNREWGFVAYAVVLLVAGLFVERLFCRYLCPLGGALAIPARLRMFDWLKRRHACGLECQICAARCTVQAIHPDGHINPNECIHCLQCQVYYHDDRLCPPLVKRRRRRESRAALRVAQRPGPGAEQGRPTAAPGS